MLSVEDVKRYYEYFYGKKYGVSRYAFPSQPKDQKLVENFFLLLAKEHTLPSLGSDFLWKYFVFQFNYWDQLDLKQVSKIQPSFILGKTAVERYDNRDDSFDWTLVNAPIISKYRLSEEGLVRKTEKTKATERIISYTDRIFRAQHLNTEQGLIMCLEYTSLYDHRDSNCLSCIHKKECKELLRVNYPLIYSQRGYGK